MMENDFNKLISDYEERLKYLKSILKKTNDYKERAEIREEIDAKTKEKEAASKKRDDFLKRMEEERIAELKRIEEEKERKRIAEINNKATMAFSSPDTLKYNLEAYEKAYELYNQSDEENKKKLADIVDAVSSEINDYKKSCEEKKHDKKINAEIKNKISIATKILNNNVKSNDLSYVRDLLTEVEELVNNLSNKKNHFEKVQEIIKLYKNTLVRKGKLSFIKNKVLLATTKEELNKILKLFSQLEKEENLSQEEKYEFMDLFNSKYKTALDKKVSESSNNNVISLNTIPSQFLLPSKGGSSYNKNNESTNLDLTTSQFLLPPKGGSSYNKNTGSTNLDLTALQFSLPPKGGSSYINAIGKNEISQFEVKVNRLIAEAYLKSEEDAIKALDEAESTLCYIKNPNVLEELEKKIKKAREDITKNNSLSLDSFKEKVENLKNNIYIYNDKKVKQIIKELKEDFEEICNDSNTSNLINAKEYLNILNDIIFEYNKKKNIENKDMESNLISMGFGVEQTKSNNKIYALNAKRIIDKMFKKTDNNYLNTIKVLKSKNKMEKLKYKLYNEGFSNMSRYDKDIYEKSQKTIAKRLLKYLMRKDDELEEDLESKDNCLKWLELIRIMPDELKPYKTTYSKNDVLQMAKDWFKKVFDSGYINELEYEFYISSAIDTSKYRSEVDDYYVLPNGSDFITYIDENKIQSQLSIGA